MKNFRENFKIANVLAKKALKKEGVLKYSLYFLMRLIFSIGLFLSPFLVSTWKIASQIKEDNKISLTGLFEPVSGKGYFHLLMANVIKLAMFLGVTLFIGIIGVALYFFGYGIGLLNVDMFRRFIAFPYLFIIPAVVIFVGLIIALPFINVPNSYIINSYPLLTPGRVLKYSFYSFRNGGRMLMFKTLLFEFGTILLYLAFAAGISIVPLLTIRDMYIRVGIMTILIIVFVIGFIFVLPTIELISILIKSNIYDEVVFVKNSNSLTEININPDDIVIGKDNSDTLNSLFKIERKKVETTSYQNTLEENEEKIKKEEALKPKPVLVEEEIEEQPIEEEIIEDSEEVISEEPMEETKPNKVDEAELDKLLNEVKDEDIEEISDEEMEEILNVIPENEEESQGELEPKIKEEQKPQEEKVKETKPEATKEPEEVKAEPVKEVTEKTNTPEPDAKDEQPEEIAETKEPEAIEDEDLDALLNSIPEKEASSTSELDEISEEELKEIESIDDAELDELLNSIPEAKSTNETIGKPKHSSEDDLDALLNSIPEKEEASDEDLDALLDSIPEKEEKKKKKTTTKKTTKKKGE